MKPLITLAALALLAGCATDPSKIAPSVATNCTSSDGARLAELSEQQRKSAKADVVGVALLGLPVGSMSGGNHKDEIARLKACVQ